MIDADHFHPELIWPYDPRLVPHPPPDVDVCAAPVVTVCMNVQWWAHVSGVIGRLAYYDAWTGSEDEKHAAIESIYKILDVGRPTMSCGCGCGGGLPSRYNSDGVFQVSYNGGTTWVNAPDQDPRNNVTQLPPPVIGEGEDGKCKAANSGVAFFKKEKNDNYALLQGVAGLSELQAAVIAFIVALGLVATGGTLAVLVGGIVAFLLSTTASEFDEAFTDAVWDDFLCALYCNMGDDLSFTDAQFQAVKSKMLEESNLIVRTWFDKFLYVIGAKGLTNAIRAGALGTMSCDSCAECPSEFIRIYALCDGTIGGTETAWDGEWLTVSSYNGGANALVRIVRDPVASASCVNEALTEFTIDSTEMVSGDAVFIEYMTAAGGYVGISPGLTPASEICAHRFTFQSGSPFVLKIRAKECP